MVNDDLISMQERINDMYSRFEALTPQRTKISLTDEQIAALRAHVPTDPNPSSFAALCGIPIERVETVEESTPYLDMVEKAERDGYVVVPAGGSTIYALKPELFGDRSSQNRDCTMRSDT